MPWIRIQIGSLVPTFDLNAERCHPLRAHTLFTKPASRQQWLHIRIAAAEGTKCLHGICAAANRQYIAAEPVTVFAVQAAIFFEPLHGVGIQNFAPQVGVVTG